MTSKIVKCASCNVVINELLAFLANVLDYMDEESIHQLVSSSFSVEKIAEAKSLLYDSLPNAKKMPIRRKEGKKRMARDLDDIIGVMKSTSAEVLPIFVAKDLHLVPSVGFDHIDCSRLLKDIARLQNQVSSLQQVAVTIDMFENLKYEMENLKHASIIPMDACRSRSLVNNRRGACLQDSLYDLNSGPIGLQYVPIKTVRVSTDEVNDHSTPARASTRPSKSVSFTREQVNATDDLERHVEACTAVPTCESGKDSKTGPIEDCAVSETETSRCTMMAEAQVSVTEVSLIPQTEGVCAVATCGERVDVNNPLMVSDRSAVSSVCAGVRSYSDQRSEFMVKNCTQVQVSDDEWQVVQSKSAKRYKLIGQKGRAAIAPDVKFKAADVKIPLFISNVSKETCEEDIINYIKEKTNVCVSLKLIKMKSLKKYNAYKLFVPKNRVDMFLDGALWPDGITFRRFVKFLYGTKQGDRNVKVKKDS
ncbi:uncharacterized protein LOC132904022 [Amyelois transitella]|uniref:uncharacterized protein LOC132904022 n=1 Tax=Amyelois transitella TaxID=680683 RepID=UPI00298F6021|nr:uncharacterized protein LOC132904022 [Amyelois transitella]